MRPLIELLSDRKHGHWFGVGSYVWSWVFGLGSLTYDDEIQSPKIKDPRPTPTSTYYSSTRPTSLSARHSADWVTYQLEYCFANKTVATKQNEDRIGRLNRTLSYRLVVAVSAFL